MLGMRSRLLLLVATLAVVALMTISYAVSYPATRYASYNIGFKTWNITVGDTVIESFVNFYPGIYFNDVLLHSWFLESPYLPFKIVGDVFKNASMDYKHFETFAVSVVDCNVTVYRLDDEIVFVIQRDTKSITSLLSKFEVPSKWRDVVDNAFCIVVFDLFNRSNSLDVVKVLANGTDWTGRRVSDISRLFDFSWSEPRWLYDRSSGLFVLVTPLHSQYVVDVRFGTAVSVPIQNIELEMPSRAVVNSTVEALITVYLEVPAERTVTLYGTLECSGPEHVAKPFTVTVEKGDNIVSAKVSITFTREGTYRCVAEIGNITSNVVYINIVSPRPVKIHVPTGRAWIIIALIVIVVIAVIVYLIERKRSRSEIIVRISRELLR